MFQAIFLSALLVLSNSIHAEGFPYDYVAKIQFKAVTGDYAGKEFVYQVHIKPAITPDHEKLAQNFLIWSKGRLEEALRDMEPSGCSSELKDRLWKILKNELEHYHRLSVTTICRQTGLSTNLVF